MSGTVITAVLVVGAYLAGSIPFGVLLGRAFAGQDVRESGSGNIGAANVSRVAGVRVAVIVLAGDILKGVVPVGIGRLAHLDPTELAMIAGFAVLGHDFSAFLRLRGGKGIATTLGIAVALAPFAGLAAAAAWLVVMGMWRYSSLASLVALWTLPLAMAVFDRPMEYVALCFGLGLLGLFKHLENLVRLSEGRETRLSFGRRGTDVRV